MKQNYYKGSTVSGIDAGYYLRRCAEESREGCVQRFSKLLVHQFRQGDYGNPLFLE